ncbi:DUF3069 domain-containing protein [Thaumasiovibrio subtropicus]|uniref:DUF3069 domain-containing protein n=1 Tax=Thaumasiovibrio subtropicus TaxID=1891207 RepID=UPI000B34E23C|nr:DUF3069 domain-containing protein [Thaumasiovibrio subtropicus]
MSEQTPAAETQTTLTLEEASPELKQVISFEKVPEEMLPMVLGVYQASEESVREAWDSMPASAQNVLDNFEQFHALVALSQSYVGLDFMEEFKTTQLPENMPEEEQELYKARLLDDVLHTAVKDLIKQIKKARLKPNMKREIRAIFDKNRP